MALAKVTIEALTQMANILRQSAEDILLTKEQMDGELYSIPWNDPVGLNFIRMYEEDFKPLKEKLIPNIEDYVQYMNKEGMIVSEYGGGIPSNGDFFSAVGAGAVGMGAAFSGLGVTGAERKGGAGSCGQNISSGVKDVGFESRISQMSEDSLKYMSQTYKEYGDLSRMAAYSYRDGNPLPEGWEDLGQNNPNVRKIIEEIGQQGGDSSGLKFSVLKKVGEEKYVIAFAGTDFPKDWSDLHQDNEFFKDVISDVQGAFSRDEGQIKMAEQAVNRLCKEGGVPLEKMEFTGHSLGGRLASEMSVQYARPATTFNAAGVSEETRKQYEYLMAHSNNHYTGVRNVVTEHDFLTNLQSMGSSANNEYVAAIYSYDFRAIGGTVVLPDGKSGISGEAHGINLVSDLLDRRQEAISNRLTAGSQWERTQPSWKENTSIHLPRIEIDE